MKSSNLSYADIVTSPNDSLTLRYINSQRRQKKLTAKEKLLFSSYYDHLGKPDKAFQILLPFHETMEWECLKSEDIFLQIRIAHKLNFFGANKTAQRLYEKVDTLIKQNCINIEEKYPQYFAFRANNFAAQGKYQEALHWINQSLLYPANQTELFFNHITRTDILEASGEFEKSIQEVSRLLGNYTEKYFFQAILHQVLGEYYVRNHDLDKAKIHLERSAVLMPLSSRKDHAYLLLWQAVYDILSVRAQLINEENKKLQTAHKILSQKYSEPRALGNCLAVKQMASKNLLKDTLYPIIICRKNLHPWLSNFLSKFQSQAYQIENNRIEIYHPCSSDSFKLNQTKKVVDLHSQIVIEQGQVQILTELQVQALYYLVASGEYGVNEWHLCELVYGDNIFSYKSLTERLKKLTQSLRKKGFTITKSCSSYVLEIDPSQKWVVPFDFSQSSLGHFLYGHAMHGDIKKICHATQYSSRQVQRLLKKHQGDYTQ